MKPIISAIAFLFFVLACSMGIVAQQTCYTTDATTLNSLFADDCLDSVHYGTYNGQFVAWAQPICPDYPGTVATCSGVFCTTGGFSGGDCPPDFFSSVIDNGIAGNVETLLNACANPVNELPWLANMLTWACTDDCVGPIYETVYNGQTVFFNVPSFICADAMTTVMDCNGEQICFFGGFIGGTGEGCPAFFESINSVTPLCDGAASDCNATVPTLELPQNTACMGGGTLPPVFTATITPGTAPSGYSLGVFVVNEAGEIVIPISGNTSLDFSSLGAGTFYARAIIYKNGDAPNLSAFTVAELNTSGGCYMLSENTSVSQIILGTEIPHVAITTPPNCLGNGFYSVGLTVTGTTGLAYFNSSNGENFILPEGVETFLTLSDEYIPIYVSDVLTGCAEDFIELYGPVNCEECINPDQIDPTIFCIEIYDPVCGCNDVTYDNWCYAYYYGGVTSWSSGACNSDNNYYYDFTICAGDSIDIGLFGMEGNVFYDWTPTTDISGCAAICGSGCANCFNITVTPATTTTYTLHTFFTLAMEHSYYYYTIIVESCGTGNATCIDSTLIDLSVGCPDIYMPVCGCNFETYGNSCEAINYSGVTTWTLGMCGESDTLLICKNDSVQIGVPWVFETLFEWMPVDGLSCSDIGCNYTWASPDTTTLYILRSFSPIGGYATVYHYLVMVENCNPNGTATAQLPDVSLYPNPASSEVWLQYPGVQVYELRVVNILGQTLLTEKQLPNQSYRLSLAQLPKGMLFVYLQTSKGEVVKKLYKTE